MEKAERTVLESIDECYERLFSAERKVADCIRKKPDEVILMNVSELAAASGASEATVVRMCKHIGYQGCYQMRLMLAGDIARNARNDSDEDMQISTVGQVFQQIIGNMRYLSEGLDTAHLLECVKALKSSRLVYVIAVGNTIPVALDLSFRLNRFKVPAIASTIMEHSLNHISQGRPEDMVIAISKSGASKSVLQGVDMAKRIGMKVLSITAAGYCPLSRTADFVLSSKTEKSLFGDIGPVSSLSEFAVNDAIIYFLKYQDKLTKDLADRKKDLDEIELMLAETKL